MNFKKYYINGSQFNINIHIRPEKYWNMYMLFLTRITTPKKKKKL